ncbi:MAG: hypothetical protein EP343_08745 [Deltaproteobacteria bacterium]|nr:MAG: hypothetical protein EP343_08745 [Deltaproteobacteria bacterium]
MTEQIQSAAPASKKPMPRWVLWLLLVVLVVGGAFGTRLLLETLSQPKRRAKLSNFAIIPAFQDVASQSLLAAVTRLAPPPPTYAKVARSHAEWYRWPAPSMYGSKANVWLATDEDQGIHRVNVTGTPDLVSRNRFAHLFLAASVVPSLRMNESTFASGLFSMSFHSSCSKNDEVREFEKQQKKLPSLFETVLKKPRGWQARFFSRYKRTLANLMEKNAVQTFLKCQAEQSGLLRNLLQSARWLQSENGLSASYSMPANILDLLRKDVKLQEDEQVKASLSWKKRLEDAKMPEGMMLLPLFHRRLRRTISFKIQRSIAHPKELRRLVQMVLSEWGVGIREHLFQQRGALNANLFHIQKQMEQCKAWKKQPRYRTTQVEVDEYCDPLGTCRSDNVPDMTRDSYCKFYLPELELVINQKRKKLDALERSLLRTSAKGKARLKEAVTRLIWDSMLRDVPLPGLQYQRAFKAWSSSVRSQVWFHMYQRLIALGISIPQIANSNLVFQVHSFNDQMVVKPHWVVDLKRSTMRWGREDVLPWVKTAKPSSSYTGDITRTSGTKESFKALSSFSGTQTLYYRGELFSLLSTFWKKNIPIRLGLAPTSHKGRRSKLEDEYNEGKKKFLSFLKFRNLAKRMQFTQKPNIARLHLIAQSLKRGSDERKSLQKSLQAIAENKGTWTNSIRHSLSLSLLKAGHRILHQVLESFQPFLLSNTDTPGIRLLVSRVFYEQGRYQTSLSMFLREQIPVGFYHPDLTWKISSNWSGEIENLDADRIMNTVVVKASSSGPAQQPVMVLQGMSRSMADDLVKAVKKAPLQTYDKEKVSEQILMLSVDLASSIKEVFEHLKRDQMQPLVLTDMVYSCQAPGSWLFRNVKRCEHPLFKPGKSDD